MQVTATNIYMEARGCITVTHKPFSNWATSSADSSDHSHCLNKSILFYSLFFFLAKLFSFYGNFWDAHSLSGLRTHACWMTVAVCGCVAVYVVAADNIISVSLLIKWLSSSHPHLTEHQERRCGCVSSQAVCVTCQHLPNETVVAKFGPSHSFLFGLVWVFQETSPVIIVASPSS